LNYRLVLSSSVIRAVNKHNFIDQPYAYLFNAMKVMVIAAV